MRKLLALASAAIAMLFVLAACGSSGSGSSETSVLDSIPDDATLLASFQVKETLTDVDILSIFAELAVATDSDFSSLPEALTELENTFGISVIGIEEIIFFTSGSGFPGGLLGGISDFAVPEPAPVVPDGGDRPRVVDGSEPRPVPVPAPPVPSRRATDQIILTQEPIRVDTVKTLEAQEQEENGALFIRGEIDRVSLIAALEAQDVELTPSVYNFQEINIIEEDDGAIAFLQSDLIVLGSLDAVKAVIDVRRGDRPAISGPMADSFEALGNPLAKLFINLPPEATEDLSIDEINENLGGLIQIDPGLFDIRSIGLSQDKTGSQFVVKVLFEYPDITSARTARDTFSALALAGALFLGGDFGELLGAVDLSFSADTLTAELSVTTEDARRIILDLVAIAD